eukprot:Protomagalhaensia_wolfi_Nauph_80__1878@NODE_2175_length_1186_cov_58_236269_g1688_i1_p1_GENE_NODE_2175_length_1186_cov_58_236269_g1688_i1NODE_2175_length_1186_cov_58_236269_g1688_i1_p1_ORF_typecomplete_len255_score34_63MCR/PF18509_1/0_08_NODE_2175_length_1186_cov_58_236269_g1688_i1100864
MFWFSVFASIVIMQGSPASHTYEGELSCARCHCVGTVGCEGICEKKAAALNLVSYVKPDSTTVYQALTNEIEAMALALPDDCALQGVTFYQGIILEDYDWCIDALEVHPSIVLTGPDLMILKHNEIRFDRLDQETMNIGFVIQYSDSDCGSDCDADVPSPFTCIGDMVDITRASISSAILDSSSCVGSQALSHSTSFPDQVFLRERGGSRIITVPIATTWEGPDLWVLDFREHCIGTPKHIEVHVAFKGNLVSH